MLKAESWIIGTSFLSNWYSAIHCPLFFVVLPWMVFVTLSLETEMIYFV